MEVFLSAFGAVGSSLLQIASIMFLAGYLFRKNYFTNDFINGLSSLVTLVALPCLSFSSIVTKFHPEDFEYWWALPVFGAITITFGLFVGMVLFGKSWKNKKDIIALGVFQNCTAMVLPIGKMVYPDTFDEFALYVFLYCIFVNPYLWSIGKVMVTNDTNISFKKFITPPLLANFLGLSIVLIGAAGYIPNVLIEPIKLMGSAAVPISTFVLGATLSMATLGGLPKIIDVIKVMGIKFFIIPTFTMTVLYYFKVAQFKPLIAEFLIIEGATASSVSSMVQVRRYGGDSKKIGSIMLVSYILSILFLPFWLALWRLINSY